MSQKQNQSASIVLGLNAFHADAAAALVIDGKLIAAAEEERFVRRKHVAGFPVEAVRWCLDASGLRLQDVDVVAVNTDPTAARWRRARYALTHWPSLDLILDRLRARGQRMDALAWLQQSFGQRPRAQLVAVEHHRAHLASSYFPSGFDRALVLSIDGMGDFRSAAWGLGEGNHLSLDDGIDFPHSLGIFYQAMTQYLGFPHYGDEYKVMGLAPYGKPAFVEPLRQVVMTQSDGRYRLNLDYFVHHRRVTSHHNDDGTLRFDPLFSDRLDELLRLRRAPDAELTQAHKDLAHSVQVVYEDAFFASLNQLHERYASDALCLAGGCAQNSVANGKIALRTPFKNIHVAAAGYDAGGAVGAALDVAMRNGGQRQTIAHAQWGYGASEREIEDLLQRHASVLNAQNIELHRDEDVATRHSRIVECMIEGGVVGWYHGRMEWGPRALGNRSILADPRRADMKDILNRKIKRRESFRPFAPSVLREVVSDWFEQDADVPFMAQVFQIREDKRAAIPAVTHVDGSGRLQTVSASENAAYHALIKSFFKRTGVPMLLNTSFNENEPIVCKPQEALDCFLRTKMDMLVLENVVLQRTSNH